MAAAGFFYKPTDVWLNNSCGWLVRYTAAVWLHSSWWVGYSTTDWTTILQMLGWQLTSTGFTSYFGWTTGVLDNWVAGWLFERWLACYSNANWLAGYSNADWLAGYSNADWLVAYTCLLIGWLSPGTGSGSTRHTRWKWRPYSTRPRRSSTKFTSQTTRMRLGNLPHILQNCCFCDLRFISIKANDLRHFLHTNCG